MKTRNFLLVSSAFVAFQFSIHAQNNGNGNENGNAQSLNKWNINGNTATSGDYIGTNNGQDLIFKSNGQEVIRINPNLESRLKGSLILDAEMDSLSSGQRFLTVGADGKVGSTDKAGLLGTIYGSSCAVLGDNQTGTLYESPIWHSIPVSSQYGYLVTGVDCPARVGIGTNTPAYEFHVIGRSYITGNIGVGAHPENTVQLNTSTNRKMGIQVTHNYAPNDGYAIKSIVNNNLSKGLGVFNSNYNKDVFSVNGQGKMVVSNASGDLFTLEPTGKLTLSNGTDKLLQLEADGLLRGRRIKLDTDTWADYVFAADYPLMPLNELEAYLNNEKHLPNVPSETEVVTEGIDLGQMNVVLLEKVEELTLYLIEQNKKIEAQQLELDAIKQQLERETSSENTKK